MTDRSTQTTYENSVVEMLARVAFEIMQKQVLKEGNGVNYILYSWDHLSDHHKQSWRAMIEAIRGAM